MRVERASVLVMIFVKMSIRLLFIIKLINYYFLFNFFCLLKGLCNFCFFFFLPWFSSDNFFYSSKFFFVIYLLVGVLFFFSIQIFLSGFFMFLFNQCNCSFALISCWFCTNLKNFMWNQEKYRAISHLYCAFLLYIR